jgi:hypothetical protein
MSTDLAQRGQLPITGPTRVCGTEMGRGAGDDGGGSLRGGLPGGTGAPEGELPRAGAAPEGLMVRTAEADTGLPQSMQKRDA